MKPDKEARRMIAKYWQDRPLGKRPPSSLNAFREKLNDALDFLGEIGANDCGDLTTKQAARFHRAVANLVKLSEELEP